MRDGLAFLWSAGGCGVQKKKYDKQVKETKKLKSEVGDLVVLRGKMQTVLKKERSSAVENAQKVQRAFETERSKATALTEQLKKLKAAMAKVSAGAAGAQAELEKTKAELAKQEAFANKLKAAFQPLIKTKDLNVVNRRGRLVIKLTSRVLFKVGKADITTRGGKSLKRVASVLAKLDRHFQVAGHTDNTPIRKSAFKDNWELSSLRAVNVVRLLLANGVPGKNLSAAGFSQFQPAVTNRTYIGKALNRRIEITLLPAIPREVK